VRSSYPTTANQMVFSQALSLLIPYRDEYEYAMEPNWDGADANALTPSVERLAADLIDEFGTTKHLTEVTPGRDGSLSFVWDDEQGSYIYLDIGPNETVHLYHDVTGGTKWEGVSVARDPQILRQLRDAFHRTGWPLRKMVVFFIPARTLNGGGIAVSAIG
jgi:hypothetical protein